MDMMILTVICLIVMFLFIILGMNVGMAMFIVGFVGLVLAKNWSAAIGILRQVPSAQASTYSFTVIPMFVLMGNAAFKSGISDGLFDVSSKWLSRLPGNLACSSVVACAVFGAICGSTIATTATIGTVALPKMKEAGYSRQLAVGAIAAGGGLGILIPPSTPLIVYGVATENSIGKLFAAGILPGVLLTIIIVLQIVVMVKRNPSLAPGGMKCAWIERLRELRKLGGIVFLFAIVLVGMFTGFFTVNEAAAIGAVASLVMMIVMRRMTWESFKAIILDTVNTTGMVFMLMVGATVFGSFLTMTKMPMQLASLISGLDLSRYVIITIIIIVYFALGCIMDALPMILLTMPIFYPIINDLGFDTVWFGIILILVVNLGVITPPVGINCYIVAGIAEDTPIYTIFKGALPFIFSILLTIVLVTVFPQIALWLPSVIYST